MSKRKVWTVKCPRCKKPWEYRNDGLVQGPMYKYCRVCSKVEADTGRGALRGSMGPMPFRSFGEEIEA